MPSILAFALAAAMLLKSHAFAPMVHRVSSKKFNLDWRKSLMANKRAERKVVTESSTTPQVVLRASDKPLTELCEITKEACEAVAPMLNGETITLSLSLSNSCVYNICHFRVLTSLHHFIQSYTLRLRLVPVRLTLQLLKATQRSSPLQTVSCSTCSSSTCSLAISLEIL